MFCPHCGQQQSSNEIRFCSKCGFPLVAVSQLLANGGVLPGFGEDAAGRKQISPRQRGVRQGATLMFIGFALTPIVAILTIALKLPVAFIPLCALLTIFAGLLRIIYATVLESSAPSLQSLETPVYVPPASPTLRNFNPVRVEPNALPGAQSIPVSSHVAQRTDTAELLPPPSVTENTTRLLQDEPKVER